MCMAAAKPPPTRITAPLRAPMSTTRRRLAAIVGPGRVGQRPAGSRRPEQSTRPRDAWPSRSFGCARTAQAREASWSTSRGRQACKLGHQLVQRVATWLADCGREAACLPRSQEMRSHNESGTPGGRPGRRSAWLRRTAIVEPPAKGVTPQASSYSMIPSAYRSVAGVGSLPSISSGAMYCGVPTQHGVRPPRAILGDILGDAEVRQPWPAGTR